jgi:hypothetical protein
MSKELTNNSPIDEKETEAQIELIVLITNIFFKDYNYTSGEEFLSNLKNRVRNVDPLFAAKTALYIRTKYNLRIVSFYIATEIIDSIIGKKWTKDFFYALVKTPNDMLDIISILYENGEKIPNSIKKAFARAFNKFDNYQLLKYSKNENFKMQDLISLVHPKPTKSNKKVINILLNNAVELKNGLNDLDNIEIINKIKDIGFY